MAEEASNVEDAKVDHGNSRWKRIILVVGGLAALAALVAGLLYWLNSRNYESTDDAFIDTQMVRIAPQVSGVVQRLDVAPNQRVTAGDLLIVINPDSVQALLSEQQAGVEQANAGQGDAQAQLRTAQARLAQARAGVAAPAADVEKARLDLARLLAVQQADPSAVADTRIDAARAVLQNAQSQLVSAQKGVSIAQTGIGEARQGLAAAAAQRNAAKARVDAAQITVGQNRIVAPLSGHIANISVNTGSYVAPGTQMMALVPDVLWVTANFKETQLDSIRPGQSVSLAVDAYPDLELKGRVQSIQRAAGQAFSLLPAQNATGNFVKVVQRVPVRIIITTPIPEAYPLGPGMSVVPTIDIRSSSRNDSNRAENGRN